jgi:hypothetical protein
VIAPSTISEVVAVIFATPPPREVLDEPPVPASFGR